MAAIPVQDLTSCMQAVRILQANSGDELPPINPANDQGKALVVDLGQSVWGFPWGAPTASGQVLVATLNGGSYNYSWVAQAAGANFVSSDTIQYNGTTAFNTRYFQSNGTEIPTYDTSNEGLSLRNATKILGIAPGIFMNGYSASAVDEFGITQVASDGTKVAPGTSVTLSVLDNNGLTLAKILTANTSYSVKMGLESNAVNTVPVWSLKDSAGNSAITFTGAEAVGGNTVTIGDGNSAVSIRNAALTINTGATFTVPIIATTYQYVAGNTTFSIGATGLTVNQPIIANDFRFLNAEPVFTLTANGLAIVAGKSIGFNSNRTITSNDTTMDFTSDTLTGATNFNYTTGVAVKTAAVTINASITPSFNFATNGFISVNGTNIAAFTTMGVNVTGSLNINNLRALTVLGAELGGANGQINCESDMLFTDTNNVVQTVVSVDGITSPVFKVGNQSTTVYTMPQTLGTPGQAIVIPTTGNQLEFATVSGSGSYTAGLNMSIVNNEISTLEQVQFTSASIEDLSGPSNVVQCNCELLVQNPLSPLSSVVCSITYEDIVITDPSTVNARYTSTLAKDSITFGLVTGGTLTSKSYMDSDQIVVPKVSVGQYGGTIMYELPDTSPGANKVLQSNASGILEWGTFSASGIQSITTNTASDLSINTVSGICTIDYIGTAGTNLTLLNGAFSVNDTMNFTNLGSINFANPAVAGSSLSETGLIIKDSLGNVTDIGSSIIQITNGTNTYASINENGIYGQVFKVISAGGVTQYQLPSTLGTSGQLLAAGGGTVLQWVDASGGSYTGSTNITITAQNAITLNAVIDLGAGSTLEANLLKFISPGDSSVLDVQTDGIVYKDSSDIVFYSLSPSACVLNNVQVLTADRSAIAYFLPSVAGSANQVLGYDNTGLLGWQTQTSGLVAGTNISIANGVVSVTPEIVITDQDAITTIDKNSYTYTENGVIINQLNVNGALVNGLTIASSGSNVYSFPVSNGLSGQTLTFNGAGQPLQWTTIPTTRSIISLTPATLSADINQDGNYTVGFLGYTAANTNINITSTTVGLADTIQLSSLGSLAVGTITEYCNIDDQQVTCVNQNGTLSLAAGGLTLYNTSAQQIGALSATGLVAKSVSVVDAGGNSLYTLPNVAPTNNSVLTYNGTDLIWGSSGSSDVGVYGFSTGILINNEPITLWDEVTSVINDFEVSYSGGTRTIAISLTQQMFFDVQNEIVLNHASVSLPIIYWPQDIAASTQTSVYRRLGNYKCSFGTSNVTGFGNTFTQGAQYLSEDLILYANFNRTTLQDTTFTFEVDVYYSNMVVSVPGGEASYGWQQASGKNNFGGGLQKYALISTAGNNVEMQKFIY